MVGRVVFCASPAMVRLALKWRPPLTAMKNLSDVPSDLKLLTIRISKFVCDGAELELGNGFRLLLAINYWRHYNPL